MSHLHQQFSSLTINKTAESQIQEDEILLENQWTRSMFLCVKKNLCIFYLSAIRLKAVLMVSRQHQSMPWEDMCHRFGSIAFLILKVRSIALC
ncbi:hypothetical protein CEXT_775071 [Caerostris extrusa]|uniref:Uncharacterized protein n=1 Tax=Caerostris extrusa TaxID=172846 RepID=A0AAV4NAY8_CAEEX|nr:hypothetical protein CEXT_775071 [Caerostris extrusa]